MESFARRTSMASRLFHTLHLLLILESSWGKLVSEDLGEAARQGADVPPAVEERVFAHGSANRDMVSINMFKVYEKYSKEPLQSQRDGNTVRGFKAVPSEFIILLQPEVWFSFRVKKDKLLCVTDSDWLKILQVFSSYL